MDAIAQIYTASPDWLKLIWVLMPVAVVSLPTWLITRYRLNVRQMEAREMPRPLSEKELREIIDARTGVLLAQQDMQRGQMVELR